MNTGNEILFADESSGFWAEIILPLALPTTYTSSIPSHFSERARPGCRAAGAFGNHNKYAAIITSVSETNAA